MKLETPYNEFQQSKKYQNDFQYHKGQVEGSNCG
jgi:hypothetical protein